MGGQPIWDGQRKSRQRGQSPMPWKTFPASQAVNRDVSIPDRIGFLHDFKNRTGLYQIGFLEDLYRTGLDRIFGKFVPDRIGFFVPDFIFLSPRKHDFIMSLCWFYRRNNIKNVDAKTSNLSTQKKNDAKTSKVSTQIWPDLIRSDQIWSDLIRFDQIWSDLIRFDQIWSDLIRSDQIWSDFDMIKWKGFLRTPRPQKGDIKRIIETKNYQNAFLVITGPQSIQEEEIHTIRILSMSPIWWKGPQARSKKSKNLKTIGSFFFGPDFFWYRTGSVFYTGFFFAPDRIGPDRFIPGWSTRVPFVCTSKAPSVQYTPRGWTWVISTVHRGRYRPRKP